MFGENPSGWGKKSPSWISCITIRWLTAVRSSIIQTSRPSHGFHAALEEKLEQLFEENVLLKRHGE